MFQYFLLPFSSNVLAQLENVSRAMQYCPAIVLQIFSIRSLAHKCTLLHMARRSCLAGYRCLHSPLSTLHEQH